MSFTLQELTLGSFNTISPQPSKTGSSLALALWATPEAANHYQLLQTLEEGMIRRRPTPRPRPQLLIMESFAVLGKGGEVGSGGVPARSLLTVAGYG